VIVGSTPDLTAAVNVTETLVSDFTLVAPVDGDVDTTPSLPVDTATAGAFVLVEHDTPCAHTTPVAWLPVRA
jgi:hypothetical protein